MFHGVTSEAALGLKPSPLSLEDTMSVSHLHLAFGVLGKSLTARFTDLMDRTVDIRLG